MKIEYNFSYKLTKKDTPGVLFRMVVDALAANGCPNPRVFFELKDSPVGRVSPTDRVIRKFPEMAAFRGTEVFRRTREPGDEQPYAILTNWTQDTAGPQPVQTQPTIETLAAIANGIPHAYPFFTAAFGFTDVPLMTFGQPTASSVAPNHCHATKAPEEESKAGIFFRSHWWDSGRRNFLSASVHGPTVAPESHAVPVVPPVTQAFLESLGRIKDRSTGVLFNNAEAAERKARSDKARSLSVKYVESISGVVRALPLPHKLPDTNEMGMDGFEKTGSLKKPLVAVFRPLGYRYASKRSGQGGYVLTKATDLNNKIELEIDTGRLTKHVSAMFGVNGFEVSVSLPLPLSPGAHPMNDYPITSIEAWERIVANMAVIVMHLERTFVPEAEAVLGQCPRWYKTDR